LVVIEINRKLLSNRQSTRRLALTLEPRLFERLVRLAMMASSCKSKSIEFWSRNKSATEIWRKHSMIPARNDRSLFDGLVFKMNLGATARGKRRCHFAMEVL